MAVPGFATVVTAEPTVKGHNLRPFQGNSEAGQAFFTPAGCCRTFGTRYSGCYDVPEAPLFGELGCALFSVAGGAPPATFSWKSNVACADTGWTCGTCHTCYPVNGHCTGSFPWWNGPQTVTGFGRTQTCTSANQYPWITGCSNNVVSAGCGICLW